jgi:uncharacterized membrane protein YcaP (DUF421 family)
METLNTFFGQGKDLSALQMSCRGVVVFIIAFLLIRIAGRRSFGVRTPLDNIITILLGAILSRAVVGASDFVPVIVCGFVIVLLHRAFSWLIVHSPKFSRIVGGSKIVLFENEEFKKSGMEKGLVCQEDIMQGVRKSVMTEDMSVIEKIYIERNGEISAIKKSCQ